MTSDSRPTGWPKLLIAALVIHAASLAAMWSHGFPRTTSDSVTFKQPAYMRLHTDFFSIPTYRGLTTYIDTIYSYPASAYILFNYGVFKTFGFSLFTSLAADLAVHFLLVTLAAWWFWRLTGNSVLAAILVLGMGHLFDPIGRPEEFGLLFSLAALFSIALPQPRYWLAIIFLGLCGATTPGTAIAGTAQVLVYHALRNGLTRSFWNRAAMIALLSPAISLAIYIWFISPYITEGLLQMQHFMTTAKVSYPFPRTLGREPFWIAFFALTVLAAFACAVYLVVRRPSLMSFQTPLGRLVMAMTVGVGVSLLFNIAAGRPRYDFRFASAESLGIIALTLSAWLQQASEKRRQLAIVAVVGLFLVSLLPNRDYARYLLASVLWKSDAVTYNQAVATIHSIVPANASVGGDSAIWTAADDGRPFYCIRWVSLDNWPDYVVATQWTRLPYVFQEPAWRKKIEESYVELTAGSTVPAEPCTCGIGGLKLSIATGRCDWDVRVWKRRDAGP